MTNIVKRDDEDPDDLEPRQWSGVARMLYEQRNELAEDLQTALNIARGYQRAMAMLDVPDPNLVELRKLCTKYKMPAPVSAQSFRVYADGTDITEHPDSIPGDAVETAELIADEEGNLHLRRIDPPEDES